MPELSAAARSAGPRRNLTTGLWRCLLCPTVWEPAAAPDSAWLAHYLRHHTRGER